MLHKCFFTSDCRGKWKCNSQRSEEKTSDRAMSYVSQEKNSDGKGLMLWGELQGFLKTKGHPEGSSLWSHQSSVVGELGRQSLRSHPGGCCLFGMKKRNPWSLSYSQFNFCAVLILTGNLETSKKSLKGNLGQSGLHKLHGFLTSTLEKRRNWHGNYLF